MPKYTIDGQSTDAESNADSTTEPSTDTPPTPDNPAPDADADAPVNSEDDGDNNEEVADNAAAHASAEFYEQQINNVLAVSATNVELNTDSEDAYLSVTVPDQLSKVTLEQRLTDDPTDGGLNIPLYVEVSIADT